MTIKITNKKDLETLLILGEAWEKVDNALSELFNLNDNVGLNNEALQGEGNNIHISISQLMSAKNKLEEKIENINPYYFTY